MTEIKKKYLNAIKTSRKNQKEKYQNDPEYRKKCNEANKIAREKKLASLSPEELIAHELKIETVRKKSKEKKLNNMSEEELVIYKKDQRDKAREAKAKRISKFSEE